MRGWRVALVVALLGLALAVGRASLSAAQPAPEAPSKLQPVADCIRNNRRVAVTFLIDESGSLKETDPDASRVTGVQAALAGLNELTQGEGRAEVHVALWGFSVRADERQPWARLTSDSLRPLQDQADQFAQRDGGFDTDYVVALEAARGELAEQVARMDPAGDSPVCKVLLWFTDGKFDIDDRLTDTAREAHGGSKPWSPEIDLTRAGAGDIASARGRDLMCRADGLVQQIRDDGIFSAIVALEAQIAAPDRDFLAAAAEGQAGAATCGRAGETARGTGAYVPAKDVEDLIFLLFGAVAPPPVPPGQVERGACPDEEPCPNGTHSFRIDPALNRFNVLAVAKSESTKLVLTAPNGQSADLGRAGAGQATLAGAMVTWNWLSSGAVLVTASLPGDSQAWVGEWKVTFVDTTGENAEAINRVAVYVFGDLVARVAPNTRLRKGEPGRIEIQLQTADGQPRTAEAFIRGSIITATVAVRGGRAEPLPLVPQRDGSFVGEYTPAEDIAEATLDVHTDLTIQTSAGVTLPTVGTDDVIPLDPPAGVARVDLEGQDALSLSAVDERDGTASGTLHLVGGSVGTSCVWVEEAEAPSLPSGVERVEYGAEPGSDEASCLVVGTGEAADLAIAGQVTGAGRGRVQADLVLRARSDLTGEVVSQVVPTRFELAVPPGHSTGRATLLLLLGVGVPLLLMYAINARAARFEPFDSVRALTVWATVSDERIRRLDGKAPLLDGEEVGSLNAPESLREFSSGSFRFRARMPWSPFGAVSGRVSAPGYRVVGHRGLHGNGEDAVVALGLGLVWVAAATDEVLRGVGQTEDGRLEGELDVQLLVLFSSEDSFSTQIDRIDDEIRRQLPDLLVALAARVGGSAGSAAPTGGTAPAAGPGDALLPAADGSSTVRVGGGPDPLPPSDWPAPGRGQVARDLPSESGARRRRGPGRGRSGPPSASPPSAPAPPADPPRGPNLPPLPE